MLLLSEFIVNITYHCCGLYIFTKLCTINCMIIFLALIQCSLLIAPPKSSANRPTPTPSAQAQANHVLDPKIREIQKLNQKLDLIKRMLLASAADDSQKARLSIAHDDIQRELSALNPRKVAESKSPSTSYPRQKQCNKRMKQALKEQDEYLNKNVDRLAESSMRFYESIGRNIQELKIILSKAVNTKFQEYKISINSGYVHYNAKNHQPCEALIQIQMYLQRNKLSSLIDGYSRIIFGNIDDLYDIANQVAELINQSILATDELPLNSVLLPEKDLNGFCAKLSQFKQISEIQCELSNRYETDLLKNSDVPMLKNIRTLEAIANLMKQPKIFYIFICTLNYHIFESVCNALLNDEDHYFNGLIEYTRPQSISSDKLDAACKALQDPEFSLHRSLELSNVYYRLLGDEYKKNHKKLPQSTQEIYLKVT